MSSTQQTSKVDEKIDLSIVIVNFNTRRLLQQCLQSIYDTAGSLALEIFIVDNASSDGSQEMIRSEFPQVKLMANPEPLGFVKAVNRALPRGAGDYFLLVHPDVVFLPGTIQEMLSFLATHPEAGIVGGNLMYLEGDYNKCPITRRSIRRKLTEFSYDTFQSIHKRLPWLHQRFNKARDAFYWDHETDTESEVIWNACMMFKREVLEGIGSFCEDFYIWFADVDWCYRAKNAGWKMYYLLNARVIHYELRSGDYIKGGQFEQLRYKIDARVAADKVRKDRYTLLKRHYSLFFLWFFRSLDTASLWIANFKLALLRVFAPSR